MFCTLALLAGCSGGGSSDGGVEDAGPPPPDAPTIATDRSQLNFGGDVGRASLLGTKPQDTLQIISRGKQNLVISSVEVVAGQSPDGGPLTDAAAFSVTGPDKTDLATGQAAAVQVVFDTTVTGRGFHGAVLRIASNAANAATVDVPMIVDVVTPEVTVVGGSTDLTIPDVTIFPQRNDSDGGRTYDGDGGLVWAQVFATGAAQFENTGTAQLRFSQAFIPSDGGIFGTPFRLCSNGVLGTPPENCQPGPLPDTLDRPFPDGGLFGVGLADGGFIPAQSELQVIFQPSQPGTYSQRVVVDSNATNEPELVFTVHGNAVPGDGGF